MKPHESLHRPDMKDVGFEEPAERTGVFFDRQKDILSSDITTLYSELDEWRKFATPDSKLRYIAILGSALHRFDAYFNMNIISDDLKLLRNRVSKHRHHGEWISFIEFANALHEFDPSFKVQEEISPSQLEEIQHLLGTWFMPRFQVGEATRANFTADLRNLDIPFEIPADTAPIHWDQIAEQLPRLRESKNWVEFAYLACSLDTMEKTMQLPPTDTNPRPKPLPITKSY